MPQNESIATDSPSVEPPNVPSPVVQAPTKEPVSEELVEVVDESGQGFLEWAEVFADYVPFFQTLLWICLILWLISKFESELAAVVTAVKKRIEAGGAVKAGPIELGEFIRPQSAAEQVARIGEESEESSESDDDAGELGEDSSDSSWGDGFRHRYVLAEDLVLRKVQEEYGALVNRQVASGDGARFDGFFALDDHPYGIEVKYVRRRMPIRQFVDAAQRIHQQIASVRWNKFTLIFAIVTDDESPPTEDQISRLREELRQSRGDTILRVFRIRDLADEFGIDLWESE